MSSLDIVFCWKSWQWVRTNSRVHGDRCEFFGHCVLLEIMAVGQVPNADALESFYTLHLASGADGHRS